MSATIVDFCTRELVPHVTMREYWFCVGKLSRGPRRTFWVDKTYDLKIPRQQSFPDQQSWTPAVLTSICDGMSEMLNRVADGPYVVERRMWSHEMNSGFRLCVVRGQWRAMLDCDQVAIGQLPVGVRDVVLALPHAMDSWTEDCQTAADAERARNRRLYAQIAKLRKLLTAKPYAWPKIERVIDDLVRPSSSALHP